MHIMRPLATCAVPVLAALFVGTAAAQAMSVTCESINYRDQQCIVPGGPVALLRQLSSPPGDCIEGQTWGFNGNNNTIWVSRGCRAEFRVGYDGAYPRPHPERELRTVTCESINYRDQECIVPGGPVALLRQLSAPPGDCIEGQTWGFNGNNTIWVSRGCRAEFRVGYDGAYPRPHPDRELQTVTCESINYRDQECIVRGGPVALLRQLSAPPGDCIEGQTWGFNGNNNTIWVSRGCRAEFRVGYR